MMHPDRLCGQPRKKLRWLMVGLPFLKTARMVTRRKKQGFWCDVLEYIESKTKQYGRRTYDGVLGKWKTMRPSVIRFSGIYSNVMRTAQESGAGDEDYVQKAMIHYEVETRIPFKLRHCWKVLKDQSEKASINLNTNVGNNDEDEVQEIRRPEGRDKARGAGRKNKRSKPTGSSTLNEDEMARLMVTEMTTLEKEERLAFLEIKMREVECREREIEQQDMRITQGTIDVGGRFSAFAFTYLNGKVWSLLSQRTSFTSL
nr:hypothetical protein [Tanacetum cinerariifolium]GEX14471.1 hypothetical protein [Tanacetum cinerariifolium]